MIVKSDMKKIFTFLVIGFLVFALHSNAVPLDSVGNNRILLSAFSGDFPYTS